MQRFVRRESISILDTASTPFQLKIKDALHICWENPSLNKQVNHVNLTLSFEFFRVKYPLFFYNCIFNCPTFTLFSIHTSDLAIFYITPTSGSLYSQLTMDVGHDPKHEL